jgi:hypothetical protein
MARERAGEDEKKGESAASPPAGEVEEEKRRPRETCSVPVATAGRTACHHRRRPAALPRPPRRPAFNEPPPPPVRLCPGHPSRPGSLLFSGTDRPPPPPTLSLLLASNGATASASCATSGLVDRQRRGACRGRPWRHRRRSVMGLCSNAGQSRAMREETRLKDKLGGEK